MDKKLVWSQNKKSILGEVKDFESENEFSQYIKSTIPLAVIREIKKETITVQTYRKMSDGSQAKKPMYEEKQLYYVADLE